MELHPKPKQAIQLNRPLIITVSIVVVTVLLLSIIAALTTSDRTKTSFETSVPKLAGDKIMVNPELRGLPGNYTDIDAIKRYSSDQSGPQLAQLLQRFNDLQGEYENLRRQVSSQERTPEVLHDTPRLQEAKNSPLVFGGLGSKVDNMLGGDDKMRSPQSPDGKDSLVATPQQEDFYRKQAENNQKLPVIKVAGIRVPAII